MVEMGSSTILLKICWVSFPKVIQLEHSLT